MDSADPIFLIGGAIGSFLVGIMAALRKPERSYQKGEAQIVSATLLERQVFMDMMVAIKGLDSTIRVMNESMEVLVALLKADAQHRHDEKIEREAYERGRRERGG